MRVEEELKSKMIKKLENKISPDVIENKISSILSCKHKDEIKSVIEEIANEQDTKN